VGGESAGGSFDNAKEGRKTKAIIPGGLTKFLSQGPNKERIFAERVWGEHCDGPSLIGGGDVLFRKVL